LGDRTVTLPAWRNLLRARAIRLRLCLIILIMALGIVTVGAVAVEAVAAARPAVDLLLRLVIATAVVLCGAISLGTFLAAGIARPITALTIALERLASGDLAGAIPLQDRQDEFGAMAKALRAIRDAVVAPHRSDIPDDAKDTQAALNAMAEAIEAAANAALAEVNARTAAMTQTAADMSSSATRTGQSAANASESAGQALVTSQNVAEAADRLAAAIGEIGAKVGKSAAGANRAVAAGHKTRTTIEALNNQVSRIGAVADMIGEIAGRTNLLALNATIEAARAGQAGKGFAVVASEVKSLAAQTARSTEDIGRHIRDVREATSAAVAAVAKIEHTIGEIDDVASSVVSSVEKEAAAAVGIAFNVTETATAANEMNDRVAEVSSEAEQTERFAVSVRENAEALEVAIAELRRAIIRVVRTSTTEVDRRQHPRYSVDMACRISGVGPICAGRITDLSLSGAQLIDVPAMSANGRGTILVEHVAVPIPFVVRSVDDRGALHVEFEMDRATRSALDGLLAPLRMQMAA
jgi:methyl-accepting chemotaxis protein